MRINFHQTLLAASLLLTTGRAFAQTDPDSIRLEAKKRRVLEWLQQPDTSRSVATALDVNKISQELLDKTYFLNNKSNYYQNGKLVGAFDVADILQSSQGKQNIAYTRRDHDDLLTFTLPRQNLQKIHQTYLQVLKNQGQDKAQLLLMINAGDMAGMVPNLMDTTEVTSEITTGKLEKDNLSTVEAVVSHEGGHLPHLKLSFEDHQKNSVKNEIFADSVMFENAGFEKSVALFQRAYQNNKKDIELTNIPKTRADLESWLKEDESFTLIKGRTHPPHAVRVLLLDLLNDAKHGDDKLYKKVKKHYNF